MKIRSKLILGYLVVASVVSMGVYFGTLSTTLFALALSLFIGVMVSRSISIPLIKLRNFAALIGMGKFETLARIESKDEIGQLAASLNQMAMDLRQTTVSRDYMDNILHSMINALVVLTPDGEIRWANQAACKLLGYKEKELAGRHAEVLFAPEGEVPLSVKSPLEDLLRGGSIQNVEKVYRSREGRRIPVLFSGSAMRGEQGVLSGIILVAQDISEHKEAEARARVQRQQLVQADKMASLGILVAGVAHEINNPNNFVIFNTPLLEKIWKDALPLMEEYHREHGDFQLGGLPYAEAREAVPKLLSGVREGAYRIKGIVEKLKDFSRRDLSGREMPVDINRVIHSAVALIGNEIGKSTKHFSLDLEENLPPTRGSFQEIEQVVINLITNACQALPDPERKIKILTAFQWEDKRLIINVVDEGMGIPPENLDKIVDPFFTTKLEKGGTGLGLSVSYNILRDHGGTLSFASEPGKGTTATVSLPI